MSDIGAVNLFGYNLLLGAIEALVVGAVSLLFSKGIKLSGIIELLGLDFVNLDHTALNSYEEYFILFCSPKFNINLMAQRLHGVLKSAVDGNAGQLDDVEIKREHISQVLDLVKGEIASNPEAQKAVHKIMNHIKKNSQASGSAGSSADNLVYYATEMLQ